MACVLDQDQLGVRQQLSEFRSIVNAESEVASSAPWMTKDGIFSSWSRGRRSIARFASRIAAAASASVREPHTGKQLETLWGTGGIKTDDTWMRLALPPRSGAIWRVKD